MKRELFNITNKTIDLNATNCNGVIDLGNLNVNYGTVNYTLTYNNMEIGVPYIIKFKITTDNMQYGAYYTEPVISFNNNTDSNIKWAFNTTDINIQDTTSTAYFEINFVRYDSNGPLFGIWVVYN